MHTIRQATLADIPDMHQLRLAVTENVLSDPTKVTELDYEAYLESKGRGWIYQIDGQLAGFAIVDVEEGTVWALFVAPDQEAQGIGRRLHDTLVNYYFWQKPSAPLRLWTGANTRAERCYRRWGWQEIGQENGEILFELTNN